MIKSKSQETTTETPVNETDPIRRPVDDVLQAVGNTPLVRLSRLGKGLKTKIYAKLEYLNPGGSIKDRMAVYILNKAVAQGKIGPNPAIPASPWPCSARYTNAALS